MKHPDYPNVSEWTDRTGTIRWRWRKNGTTKYLPGQPHSKDFNDAYVALTATPLPLKMKHPDYPNVSQWADRTGNVRWRCHKNGATKYLPGEPHSKEFDDAYLAFTHGAETLKPAATIGSLRDLVLPKTFGAAYRELKTSLKWQELDEVTRRQCGESIESFLDRPVVDNDPTLWRDLPVGYLKFDHVQTLMDEPSIEIQMRKSMLMVIRRLVHAARIARWVESDPTAGVEFET